MHSEEAESLWRICHSPEVTTIDDIDMIFFERKGYDKSRPFRYYIKSALANPALFTESSQVTVTPPSTGSSQTPYETIQKAVSTHRQSASAPASSASSVLSAMNEDFTLLPEGEGFPKGQALFTIDREKQSEIETFDDFACRETLAEMMFIVKKAREGRNDIMEPFQIDMQPQELRASRGSNIVHDSIDLDSF
jgi:hypothetical protein